MLTINVLGLNHTTAPVELRECLAFSREETSDAMEDLHRQPGIREVILVSTCNRVEVLFTANSGESPVEGVKQFLADYNKIPLSRFEQVLYRFEGDEAVRHVFRVAASLDSLVVGEPQILGQIKEAYRTATLKKTSGVVLNRLMHRTFFVAKRIRSETGIGDHAVSISYAAVELGRKIFGTLEGKKALLIGAGEMAELAVEHLIRNRVDRVLVANRTFERAVELAGRFKGEAIRFEEIGESLKQADIIVSSTGSPHFVITRDQVKAVMRSRKNRPIFFIDIAVPRDIDPEINGLGNAYVYDIDDLKGVIDENIEDRKKEAVKAERIIDEAVIRFRQWYESLEVVPTIVALRNKMDAIARSEIKKTLASLNHLSEEECQAFYRMTNAMVNKFLHDPTMFLKDRTHPENSSLYLDLIRNLFKLDEP